MGDHSKTAIHTAFNTASVVGAMCNVFGNVTSQASAVLLVGIRRRGART